MHHPSADGSISSKVHLFVWPPIVWRGGRYARALCSLLFLFSLFRAIADFTGPVIRVLDGDTIEVLHNNHAARIPL
jgi:hypothetical protein